MKKIYLKPSLKIIDCEEDVAACICGSRCSCSGGIVEWWNWLWHGGCGCKVSRSSYSSSTDDFMEEETDLPKSKNLWEDEW